MKSSKLFLLFVSLALLSLTSCKSNGGESIENLKGVLENQKDKTTVQLKEEGSDKTELYFLRNDALHPRLVYITTGNEMEIEKLQHFWRVNNFSTSYYKNQGIFMARYRNNIDSAVLFTKYYLYDILKVDPKKKFDFEVSEGAVIQ